ncbi:hypothetical protein RZS08_51930, partial [Arthrospira platensis SPKY1]|nr:hypothetical protein [Arthrospira platensis SPKY1]
MRGLRAHHRLPRPGHRLQRHHVRPGAVEHRKHLRLGTEVLAHGHGECLSGGVLAVGRLMVDVHCNHGRHHVWMHSGVVVTG